MDIRRHDDWQKNLTGYLLARSRQDWAYGTMDCALFAAGAVEAMTGVDLAEGYRGHYGTLKEGVKLLRNEGVRDHVALAAALFEEIHPAYARPGDLAVLETAEGPALGVVQGEHVYVGSPRGLKMPSRMEAVRAFRVP